MAAEGLPMVNVFSIRAANETLREVLKKISEASGYEIRFNKQLADEKITIQLDNVNLNEALARVLQQYNHISLWDDSNDIVTILFFRINVPPVTISGMNKISQAPPP
jgi:type II secretory pathway component GspD/PulD (secretin)